MLSTILKKSKKTVLTSILVLFVFAAFSQTIKGKVTDAATGEPLIGATVQIEHGEARLSTQVNLDGSYVFKKVTPGHYELKVKFVGYQTSAAYSINAEKERIVVQNVSLQDNMNALNEVSVSAHASRESDGAVRGLEKNANSIENVLSQNTIQLLPDLTIGNALQRVSGVTIQRTGDGEGRYAIIRGMDQRYNNTLVNGIKIPSPDDKYRFVPMDIFPSEMLERLEVIKALTPAMEGDAIGGTMNLVMKSAPDKLVISANAAGGYSTLFSGRPFSTFDHTGINMQSPAEMHGNDYAATAKDFSVGSLNYHNVSAPVNSSFGLTVGDRFLNHKLGVLLSASYQNFFRGSNSYFLEPNAQPNPGNTPFFAKIDQRQYSTQTTLAGLNNKIDYVINKRNKITLYNLYLQQNEYQNRLSADTVLGINSTAALKEVDIEHRSTWTKQTVYNGTLKGEHTLTDKLQFNWSGVYSIAKKDVPDMASYVVENDVHYNSAGAVNKIDSVTKSMDHQWQHNSDQDLAGYGNFIYHANIANRDVEFSLGGLYRHKTRTNYFNDYKFIPSPSGVQQPFHDINSATFGFNNPSDGVGNISSLSPNDYTAHEDINAEYLQLKFNLLPKLQVLGGVRVENTAEEYLTAEPITFSQRSGTIKYTDVLPSLHLKYELSDIQNLRLSYYKGISRPGFADFVPISTYGDDYDLIGNTNVKHTTSDNYDFRYELFPGGANQVLLGAFYKDIQNPIEYLLTRNGGPSAQFIQPVNVNGAKNYGLEALITRYFGMFGVSANYTYTHSRVTTDKLFYNADATTSLVTQSRPLQGQADHVGNLSALYKNPKIGLDLQVSYVYTGERIVQVSPFYDLDYWQHPYSQLAFSFEKTIGKKGFSVFGKANNLTNSASKVYLKYPNQSILQQLPVQDKVNQTLVRNDIYEISLLGGVRYKFL